MIVGDIIERNERLYPDETAIVFENRRLTYRSYAERARRLANALADFGLRRQDRVAILSQNRSEYLEVYGACELAGFIIAPINYRLAPPEIAHILRDCEPSAVVFEARYGDTIAALRDAVPESVPFICVGPSPAWARDYEALLAAADGSGLPFRARDQEIVYLMYTSGTTGRPKGVMLHQDGQARTARLVAGEGGIERADRFLLTMPLYHVGGKCLQLGHMWRGGAVFIHSAFDPDHAHATIEAEGITTTLMAPTMIRAFLDSPAYGAHDLSSLRTIFYAASAMPGPLLRRAMAEFGPIFIQFYGSTETGPMGTALYKHQHVLDGSPEQTRRLASAGQPSPTCEVRIVGDDGADCAAGEPGEILIRNPSVMRGYWNKSVQTLETLREGWVHTGDIGTFDEEGFVFLVDRKNDMIISGGENIYPREVEEALYQHPAVAEAAVIGIPDDRWGEAVAAFVVLRSDATAEADELIEHCRALIASYKKPKRIEFLGELPKLPNGKVDKKQLRALFRADRAAGEANR